MLNFVLIRVRKVRKKYIIRIDELLIVGILFLIPNVFVVIGFDHADSACCHLAGRYGGLVPCVPPSKVCPDRSKYVFWDPYHPSDKTNSIIAKRLVDGDIEDISPLNIRALFKR